MPTVSVTTTSNDNVTVINRTPVTLYYRGRYYRQDITTAITPTGFRAHYRYVRFGDSTGLRWFLTNDDTLQHLHYTRYDDSHVSVVAPF